jgi:hypothetical protein
MDAIEIPMKKTEVPSTRPIPSAHYVYLYRDLRDKVRYVGYGTSTQRATSHLRKNHNARLSAFLAARAYHLQVAGPFETEQTGRAVEAALISTLKPDLNIDPGPDKYRFRPLGVPLAYADRLVEPELTLSNFRSLQGARPAPILFVRINDTDFADNRVGYNPARPPTDDQIRERCDRWFTRDRPFVVDTAGMM